MARNGRNYFGCDHKSAVNTMSEIVEKVYKNENTPGKFSYCLTDITNPYSIIDVASSINGEIAMCCEG